MDSPSKVAAVETDVRQYKNTIFVAFSRGLILLFRRLAKDLFSNKNLVTISIVVEKGQGQTSNFSSDEPNLGS